MNLTVTGKIKLILIRKNMTMKDLADTIGTSKQNLFGKFKKNNFSEKDLNQISEALNYDYEIVFINRDTGEKI